MTIVRICFLSACCLLNGSAMAAPDKLVVTGTTLFQDGRGQHGVWPSSYGKSQLRRTSEGDIVLLRLRANAPGLKSVLTFNKHRPVTPQVLSAQPDCLLRMILRSSRVPEATISAGWRLSDGSKGAAVSARVVLSPDGWTECLLPAPALPAHAKASGLILTVSRSGVYDFREIALVTLRAVCLAPPDDLRVFLHQPTARITGQVADGVKRAKIRVQAAAAVGTLDVLNRTVPVTDGAFALELRRDELIPGKRHVIMASVSGAREDLVGTHSVELFAYPAITGTTLPPIALEAGRLMRNGKPFGFVGTNFTAFQLGLSNRSDYELLVSAIDTMADWGVSVVRVPLNLGLIQVEEGIFPDNPRWEAVYREHRLDPQFMAQFDYFVAYAGQRGIHTIVDWHGYPTNPFRHFLGGNAHIQGSGKPGGAIAWLAKDKTKREPRDLSNPRHLTALLTTHAWLARHLKGNPNILGFEVPYNEPHDEYLSIQANLARVISLCTRAIKDQDPGRLTFSMMSNYGHNNSTWISTWLPPAGVDGGAPHFYLANGPVPLRPEASTMKRNPWLCRDVAATFSYSLPAVLLPFSAVRYPLYNGEGGEHGARSLLPDLAPPAAWEAMLECSFVQYYAAGFVGSLNWTLWENRRHFPAAAYRKQLRRFSPVYSAGPVDWSGAEIAFVQNVAAAEIANGHNFSCVPIAKLMLDLHLFPIHYLTDDHLIFGHTVELSKGLEQVEKPAAQVSRYRAFVVDRRNLDQRVERMLNKLSIPMLWVDDMSELKTDELAPFLEKAGLPVDRRTPREIHMVHGPQHLVVYRREGEDAAPVLIYPRIPREGIFSLIKEDGAVAYEGSAAGLGRNGMMAVLEKWQSRIYRIEATSEVVR